MPGTEQTKSVDVVFAKPHTLKADFAAVTGLYAGKHKNNEAIAKLAVTTDEEKSPIMVTGDYDAKGYKDADGKWQVTGKNGGKINVNFFGSNAASEHLTINGHTWWKFKATDKISVALDGDQDVAADTYPITLHVGEYQS
ncbi:Saf-pilin pilus formation protein SafA [Yersinia enterocolitica]|uniref:Saf-pilin pilus formation protein SafA n=1 Tax=Yersinia enterocolitica TaxID=630 RepID=UPI001C8F1A6F|nr:Saf-pilin pilus formation protein SafA [Yersinia enterocolitica]MBX9498735.1 Saf-pilin pilus formation protein SafA [Yersinia enterocolitica]